MTMEKRKYEKPHISREQLEELLIRTNEELTEANRKLKQEEKSRMELFANLSHDLRSPMTALLSSVECLKADSFESGEERRTVLELMERRLSAMQNLINDLFLLSRIESSDMCLQLKRMSAEIFLEEIFYEKKSDPLYKERRLRMELPENFEAEIVMDPEQMSRVLDNLFSNALKYSEKNAVIRLTAYVRDGMLYIEVSDTGLGIAKEDLPHIFDRSYRVSRSRTPGDNSSGLGLAIAKGIVEKHGGEIGCESKPGQGSRFAVKLPVA